MNLLKTSPEYAWASRGLWEMCVIKITKSNRLQQVNGLITNIVFIYISHNVSLV